MALSQSLDVWDPFTDFPSEFRPAGFADTRIDWKETPEAHVYKADLPGVNKEDARVEVEGGRVLQISGERSGELEGKDGKWRRAERGIGKFFRRFRLPENAKADLTTAAMENGVLTVTVPKEQAAKEIEVNPIEICG